MATNNMFFVAGFMALYSKFARYIKLKNIDTIIKYPEIIKV